MADSVTVLHRDGHGFTLFTRGRDIEEAEHAVRFDKTTQRWTLLGVASEVRQSDERREILKLLQGSKEPMTPAEVADLGDMRRANVRQMMRRMVEAGTISKAGYGRYCCTPVTPVTVSHLEAEDDEE